MIIEQRSKDQIRLKSPAKINLFLEVLRKRPDGFHDINSLFQAVSLYDELNIRRLPGQPECLLELPDQSSLSTGADNLICRAYDLVKERFKLTDGLRVELKKQIPIAAGLGGGSSNAASTLLAISIMCELGLDYPALADLSAEIGSDIPFFFSGGQALVTGRGEVVNPTDYPVDYWVVLVTPEVALTTAASYAALSLTLTSNRKPFSFQRCGTALKLIDSLGPAGNDFEKVHFKTYPELISIRDELLQSGALLVRLSGSGPTVFGLFTDEPTDQSRRLNGHRFWQVTIAQPVLLAARLP